jgi:hypothetical protein
LYKTDRSGEKGEGVSYEKVFSTETVTVGLEYPIPFPILLSGKKRTYLALYSDPFNKFLDWK